MNEPASRWRVSVDETLCLGSGSCVGIAPGHFRLDGYVSEPLCEIVAPDDDLLSAADACPAEAIIIRDELTGEPVTDT